MLSNEETESLLDVIIKRAFNSASMQRRLRESGDFAELCNVLLKPPQRQRNFKG
jgi:hypothetical protein